MQCNIACRQVANTRLKTRNTAILTRKLATKTLGLLTLETCIPCGMIPLDKNPGVRPIGVGDVLSRIVGKCLGWVLKEDIQLAAGPLQRATGLQSGV